MPFLRISKWTRGETSVVPITGNRLSFANLIALFYRDRFHAAIDRNAAVLIANHYDLAVALYLAVKKYRTVHSGVDLFSFGAGDIDTFIHTAEILNNLPEAGQP